MINRPKSIVLHEKEKDMEQFKIMYKILNYLAKSMEYEDIDVTPITAEQLDISKPMWNSVMCILVENGYVGNVQVRQYTHQKNVVVSNYDNIKITLKGLEYLEDNSMMRKCANIAKGIKEIVPFV